MPSLALHTRLCSAVLPYPIDPVRTPDYSLLSLCLHVLCAIVGTKPSYSSIAQSQHAPEVVRWISSAEECFLLLSTKNHCGLLVLALAPYTDWDIVMAVVMVAHKQDRAHKEYLYNILLLVLVGLWFCSKWYAPRFASIPTPNSLQFLWLPCPHPTTGYEETWSPWSAAQE